MSTVEMSNPEQKVGTRQGRTRPPSEKLGESSGERGQALSQGIETVIL